MNSDDFDVAGHHSIIECALYPALSDFVRIPALTLSSAEGAFNVPARKSLARIRRTVFMLSAFHDFPTYLR